MNYPAYRAKGELRNRMRKANEVLLLKSKEEIKVEDDVLEILKRIVENQKIDAKNMTDLIEWANTVNERLSRLESQTPRYISKPLSEIVMRGGINE